MNCSENSERGVAESRFSEEIKEFCFFIPITLESFQNGLKSLGS